MIWDDIALEIAIIERLARDAVRQKLASQQLGEAWINLPIETAHHEIEHRGLASALSFSRD